MGSPRQTFAGETRLSRAGGQGQPRDGVPPSLRYILAFWNSLDPASLPQQGGQRGEGGGRREGIWDSLPPPRNIYFTPKKNPAPPNPIPNNAFPSVVDLSPTVFQDQTLQENWNLPRRRRRRPEAFLPFLKSRSSSSQLVFKLSLVKTISSIPPMPKTLQRWERRHFQTSMRS